MLEPIDGGEIDHAAYIHAVKMTGYDGWVSIEMKTPDSNPKEKLLASVARIREILTNGTDGSPDTLS